ncbi:MAG: DUF3742 family protein [Fulvimonas sp.]|nr:DUF3742 family protein [Fulvimonas sp.]
MSTKTHRSNAEQLGHWLGGVWRGYTRREHQATAWLVSQGVPTGGAVALLWTAKLGLFGILPYMAGWLALLVALLIVATRIAAGNQHEPTAWAFPAPDARCKGLGGSPGPLPFAHGGLHKRDGSVYSFGFLMRE